MRFTLTRRADVVKNGPVSERERFPSECRSRRAMSRLLSAIASRPVFARATAGQPK